MATVACPTCHDWWFLSSINSKSKEFVCKEGAYDRHVFYANRRRCKRCQEDFTTVRTCDFNESDICPPCKPIVKQNNIDKFDGKTPGTTQIENCLQNIRDRLDQTKANNDGLCAQLDRIEKQNTALSARLDRIEKQIGEIHKNLKEIIQYE